MQGLITPALETPQGRSPQPQGMGLDDQVYNRLLRERIIFLGSVVEDANANAICAQLLLLAADDPDKDIWLYINSPGGSVSAGMAIYDTMQWVTNDVATVVDGPGRVDGAVPALRRHPGQALRPAARADHDAPALRRHRRHGVRHPHPGRADALHQEEMAELIAFHTGQTVEQIERDSDRDRWFTADEAKEYGLVDQVVASAGQVAGQGGTA